MAPARSRILVVLLVLLALVAAGCGDGDSGSAPPITVDATGLAIDGDAPANIQATPRFLGQVADRTEAADTLRYAIEMHMRMSVMGMNLDIVPTEPIATGAVEGDRYAMVMDLGVLMDAMADQLGALGAELDGLDLTMELAGDTESVFLRAPYFSQLGALGGGADELGPLADLGDGWAYIDVVALGDVVPSDVLDSLGGAQTADPMAVNELLRVVGDEVTEVGRTTVRGVEVTHLTGLVSLADLMDAQGMTAETLEQQLGPQAAELGPYLEGLAAVEAPIDVYVDDDENLRRIAYEMDLGAFMDEAAQAGGEPVPGGMEMVVGSAVDFYDLGAADITVELPDPAGAVDLTEWMLEAAARAGLN